MKHILMSILMVTTIFLFANKLEAKTDEIYVFSQPGCGHCDNARLYMQRYYKDYPIKEINIRQGNNMGLLLGYAKKFNVPQNELGTPFIVLDNEYVMGWGEEQIKKFNKYAKKIKR